APRQAGRRTGLLRVHRGRGQDEGADAQNAEKRSHHGSRNCLEAYHEPLSRFSTSPSRKIDPATTIRGDRRHASASASSIDGAIVIVISGAAARAASASAAGSAAREFDARVSTR